MRRRHREHLLRDALALVASLVPQPWDLLALVDRIAETRGRPISLHPWDLAGCGISGLWLQRPAADYIFYELHSTPAQREQIIGHELGHILLAHTPRVADGDGALTEALAPNLSPELRARMLTRGEYGSDDEAAAEEFGTRLLRLRNVRHPSRSDSELGRLTDVL